MTAPDAPQARVSRFQVGHRYLVREGSWSGSIQEVRVIEIAETAVRVEHEGGNRRWHSRNVAYTNWIVEEDLGPVVERDPTAELVEALESVLGDIENESLHAAADGTPFVSGVTLETWDKASAALAKWKERQP